VLSACAPRANTRGFTTPASPLLNADSAWPLAADFKLLGQTTATACSPLAQLRLGGGDYEPTGAGHPTLVAQARYEAIEKAKGADNLLAARVKVQVSGGRECVTVSGRAYRVTGIALKPAAVTAGTVGGAPARRARRRGRRSRARALQTDSGPGAFGWSMGLEMAYAGGMSLTTHASFPVGSAQPLQGLQHRFALDLGASLVMSDVDNPEDVVPRLGLGWYLWLAPEAAAYARAHLDYRINGYAGETSDYDDGYGYSYADRSNQGFGAGVEAGFLYKFGGLTALVELGTQHIGVAVGTGF